MGIEIEPPKKYAGAESATGAAGTALPIAIIAIAGIILILYLLLKK
jgi:hypothetical protein